MQIYPIHTAREQREPTISITFSWITAMLINSNVQYNYTKGLLLVLRANLPYFHSCCWKVFLSFIFSAWFGQLVEAPEDDNVGMESSMVLISGYWCPKMLENVWWDPDDDGWWWLTPQNARKHLMISWWWVFPRLRVGFGSLIHREAPPRPTWWRSGTPWRW